jgi:hypothetical protein
MKNGLAVLGAAVCLCSCASTKLPNTQTAAEQFSVLDGREKGIARQFYDLGSGDAIRRLYWAQREAQASGRLSDAPPATNLQRKYVVVPVPEHTDPDGTVREASYQVVEVVQ